MLKIKYFILLFNNSAMQNLKIIEITLCRELKLKLLNQENSRVRKVTKKVTTITNIFLNFKHFSKQIQIQVLRAVNIIGFDAINLFHFVGCIQSQ